MAPAHACQKPDNQLENENDSRLNKINKNTMYLLTVLRKRLIFTFFTLFYILKKSHDVENEQRLANLKYLFQIVLVSDIIL